MTTLNVMNFFGHSKWPNTATGKHYCSGLKRHLIDSVKSVSRYNEDIRRHYNVIQSSREICYAGDGIIIIIVIPVNTIINLNK